MGYLDIKGLKKVVNRIKLEINDKVNSISIPEAGQPIWGYMAESTTVISLPAYVIYELNGTADKTYIYFDYNEIPYKNKEYKLISKGTYLNTIDWPSIFDMPWPNNEIPVFEEDKQYEIYIAWGRVVSVLDVTPLVEEVTYTITTKDQGYAYINIEAAGSLDHYENGEFIINDCAHIVDTLDKALTFTYTVKGDLSKIWRVATQNLQYIKVDCSKMKSNNFHNVTYGLKIDEIIYPQACVEYIQDPSYNFEAPDLEFDFLRKNTIVNPYFGDLISNKNLNKILNLSNFPNRHTSHYFSGRSAPYTVGSFICGIENFYYNDTSAAHPKYVGYEITDASSNITIASEEFSVLVKTGGGTYRIFWSS